MLQDAKLLVPSSQPNRMKSEGKSLNFLDQLERKIGKFAIPGLMRYVIACYIIGFGMLYFANDTLELLMLSPAHIMEGQVWRLLTWVIVPPSVHPIFVIFLCLLYYRLGMTLERTWGSFKFNLYFFSGIFFTIIGAFALFLLVRPLAPDMAMALSQGIMQMISTNYINLSLFLAFAMIYPDTELYLMLAIPVKIKYLAMVSGGITFYMFLMAVLNGNIGTQIVIGASLLNFVIFALFTLRKKRTIAKGYSGQRNFKKEMKARQARPNQAIHQCFDCGRTDQSHPDLEFRYCSKCNGNYEYCQDHLFTHVHKL